MSVIHAAMRARYIAYSILAGGFALLFTYVTIRFAFSGEIFETLLLAALTLGMAYQSRRFYRRMRAVGGEVERHEAAGSGDA